jgi:hypothetical protein
MTRSARFLLLAALTVAVFVLWASAALAHVPQLPDRGPTLETATVVDDPATSWVFYGTSPDLRASVPPWLSWVPG